LPRKTCRKTVAGIVFGAAAGADPQDDDFALPQADGRLASQQVAAEVHRALGQRRVDGQHAEQREYLGGLRRRHAREQLADGLGVGGFERGDARGALCGGVGQEMSPSVRQ